MCRTRAIQVASVLGWAQHGAAGFEGAGLCPMSGLPVVQIRAEWVCPCGPVHWGLRADPQRGCQGVELYPAHAGMEWAPTALRVHGAMPPQRGVQSCIDSNVYRPMPASAAVQSRVCAL